jgi:hypothetical protein
MRYLLFYRIRDTTSEIKITITDKESEANVSGKVPWQRDPNVLCVLARVSIESVYKVIGDELLPMTCKQQSESLKRLAPLLSGKARIRLENPQRKILQLSQSSLKVLVVRDDACLAHVSRGLGNPERFGCRRYPTAPLTYGQYRKASKRIGRNLRYISRFGPWLGKPEVCQIHLRKLSSNVQIRNPAQFRC